MECKYRQVDHRTLVVFCRKAYCFFSTLRYEKRNEVPAVKRILTLLLCLMLMLSLFPVTALAVTTIGSLSITDVPTPRPGNPIPTGVTVETTGTELDSVIWYDETAGKFVYSGSDYFIGDHVYKLEVWVAAKSGYEFAYTNSYTPKVTATVEGKTATVGKAYEYNAWAMVVVSYTFAPCANKTISSVNIELNGLTKEGNVLLAREGSNIPFSIFSVSDDVRVYPQLNTNRYYPYGFHWSNITKDTTAYSGDRFKGGCDYYVTIAIEPVGATFTEDLSVTINGKKADIREKGTTYAGVSVEVTCYANINGSTINPVVMLPIAGNNPDHGTPSINSTGIEYAYTPQWYDVETGNQLDSEDTFVGGKQYRVEITCMAAYAHQFLTDANGKLTNLPYITGQEVDSYSFGYDSYRGRETITLVKTFTATGGSSQHTHTPSAWRTTGAYHYKACTTCGEFLEQEDHKGGVATCTQKGKCTVCGYAYLETNENHTPDTSKWIALTDYHYHACKLCGAQCDADDHRWSPTYLYKDTTGHAWICADCKAHSTVEKHNPGPAATETEPQTCKDCGYIIEPAKNHTHELTKVPQTPATCTQEGNIEYYTCSGCSERFTDGEGKNKIPENMSVGVGALGHTTSEAWGIDETYHWRTCTTCDQVLDETKMQHDVTEGKCTTCGYVIGSLIPEQETRPEGTVPGENEAEGQTPTAPKAPTANDPNTGAVPVQEEKGSKLSWVLLVAVGLTCFAATVTATVIILKKKKN